MSEEGLSQPLIALDFSTSFPHKFWISGFSHDESYPKGFRYKILSARRGDEDIIEMVVVLEEPGGRKTELKRLEVSLSAFDRTAQIFVVGLAEEHGLDFEELDLSGVRTFETFDERVTEAGWHEWQP